MEKVTFKLPFPKRHAVETYEPLLDGEGEDQNCHDEGRCIQIVNKSAETQKISILRRLFLTVTGLYVVFSAVTLFVLAKDRVPQPYSPANHLLSYQRQRLYFGEDEKFTGHPKNVDEAWDYLLEPINIRATEKELQQARAEFSDDIVRLVDGDYIAVLSVHHELHCLDALRRNIFPEYYYDLNNTADKQMNIAHMTHCVDTIRRSLMCKADVSLYTAYWIGDHTAVPSKELRSKSDTVSMTEETGTVDFAIPGLSEPAKTWYRVLGGRLKAPDSIPLIILHGGPGACHDYLLPHSDLAKPNRPIVFYDQIGNGRSSHFPDKAGDESFWSVDLFVRELDNLLAHLGLQTKSTPIDVYGHSWGGMLAAVWASRPSDKAPKNLRRLIISSSLASMDLFQAGVKTLRNKLPPAVQEVLDRCEKKKDFESPEYEAAVEVFYKRHLSLTRPWPAPEVQAALDWFARDPTTYGTMYGPSELYVSGSLRNWTVIPRLDRIRVPTLLLNGREDEAQDVAMQPFFNLISKVKWVTLEAAAHFTHVDQRGRHMEVIREFLATE
ncbi:Alpha/Beta hydrolase protein [Rhypophila decipiens]|uniref:Alpha/Beta hydrolase protein n=1 Tax=Rhypophila decipiens TaxID=261697 RepID=A0AAN7B6A9_9PEZI|nr:Alpha/Beta hydrolase protein [Rhypophila decipiens]